jgi:quercetin dioxygenase-like cupin family protein
VGLHIARSDVYEHFKANPASNPLAGGAKTSIGAAGNECSLSSVTRVPGYHTLPHQHDSEQINYIADGEIWFFVEERAYQCRAGDFQRVPRNLVHWAWNRSDKPATVIETHAPGAGPVGPNIESGPDRGLWDEGETPKRRSGAGRPDARVIYDQEIAEDAAPLPDGLYIPGEKLSPIKNQRQGVAGDEPDVRGVYGTESGLATVTWPAGYHSSPYVHDAEVLLQVLEGEIWFFVENKGFKVHAGDFQRIPRNAIHWEWNQSDKPARALVQYCPPVLDIDDIRLQGGVTSEGWFALFEEGETPRLYGNAKSYGVTFDGSATEARMGLA